MKFSFYKHPITNSSPRAEISLEQLYKALRSDFYKEVTKKLRDAKEFSESDYKHLKITTLDYITIGGTFSSRSTSGLKISSGYMMLDIDHLDNAERLKGFIVSQNHKYPIKLVFTSPSGDGLKVVVSVPNAGSDYSRKYKEVADYWRIHFNISVDRTSDIARACFLCYDPKAWIHKESDLNRLQNKYPAVKELIERLDLVEIK